MANPIKKDYIAMGEGKGISVTLWPNSLQLERKEKEGTVWKTTEKMTLAPKVLEYLAARIPAFIALMESQSTR